MKEWFKKTAENKIVSIILEIIGIISISIDKDIMGFVFISLIAVPLFFAKRDYMN